MYIFYDTEGNVTGSMTCRPESVPQGDKIEVSDDTVLGPLTSYKIIDGALVQVDIKPVRLLAIENVNYERNRIRQKFITPITGQEMLYMEKEREAVAFLAESPEPTDLTNYPFIAAEVGITAPTAHDVAQVYINLAAYWRVVGPQLEALCLGSTAAIEVSVSAIEIEGILANFNQMIAMFG